MENQVQFAKEYFDLIVYLNRANHTKNLKTEITFDIRKSLDTKFELQFGCSLKGGNNNVFLVLGNKLKKRRWEESRYTKFYLIENFCIDVLNNFV